MKSSQLKMISGLLLIFSGPVGCSSIPSYAGGFQGHLLKYADIFLFGGGVFLFILTIRLLFRDKEKDLSLAHCGLMALSILMMGWPTIRQFNFNKDGFQFFRVEGVPAEKQLTQRLEFWTPSVSTKLGEKEKSDPNLQWSVKNIDEERLQKFWSEILDGKMHVQGYRREEVWGQGKGAFKAGWWWTITVGKDFSVDQFVENYRTFWHAPVSVRVEVISNDAGYK